jgi:curved DNA-binding protein CbpA
LGVTVDRLKTMDRCALTRQYRKRALQHHPDRGGDPENFVKLSAAYRQLLMGKARR